MGVMSRNWQAGYETLQRKDWVGTLSRCQLVIQDKVGLPNRP